MTNYAQTTFFTPKDSLPTTDPNKTIFGAAYDVEFGNVATAIASKFDTTSTPTFAGAVTAPAFIPNGSTLPTNGLYLPSANTLGLSAGSTALGTFATGGIVIGGATGGAKGAGTINAVGLFVNGIAPVTTSANPTATIGLAAVNGTATTFMTSDSAPPLSQAIAPTWSALHIFTGGVEIGSPTGGSKGANTINSPIANTYLDGTVFQAIAPTWTSAHIFSPASGQAITVNAVANSYGVRINGNSTAGQSLGLLLEAGTNSSDKAVLVTNQSGATAFLRIFGDGSGNLGPNVPTNGMSWAAAGSAFTMNVTSGTPLTVQASGTSIFQALGIVAPTLKGYGPIAAGLVDLTPDASTFTITYTGMTAAVTGTAVWTRVGNLVLLFLPVATGTSNATTMQATGIPNAINPTRAQWLFQPALGVAEDTGTSASGACRVNTNNTIDFSVNGNVAGLSSWTASGTKGIQNGYTIMYLLN